MSTTSSNTHEFTYDELMSQYVEATRIIEELKSRIIKLKDYKYCCEKSKLKEVQEC